MITVTKTGTENLKDSVAGYIAGFLDADGSIEASVRPTKAGNLIVINRITFTNRNKDVIDWISQHVPFDGHYDRPAFYRKKENRYHGVTMMCYLTVSNREHVRLLLEDVLEFLIVKKNQAILTLKFLRQHAPWTPYTVNDLRTVLEIKEATDSRRAEHIRLRQNLATMIKEMESDDF